MMKIENPFVVEPYLITLGVDNKERVKNLIRKAVFDNLNRNDKSLRLIEYHEEIKDTDPYYEETLKSREAAIKNETLLLANYYFNVVEKRLKYLGLNWTDNCICLINKAYLSNNLTTVSLNLGYAVDKSLKLNIVKIKFGKKHIYLNDIFNFSGYESSSIRNKNFDRFKELFVKDSVTGVLADEIEKNPNFIRLKPKELIPIFNQILEDNFK